MIVGGFGIPYSHSRKFFGIAHDGEDKMDKSEFKVSEGTNSLMKWTVSRCGKAREVVFKPSIFVMTGCRGRKILTGATK